MRRFMNGLMVAAMLMAAVMGEGQALGQQGSTASAPQTAAQAAAESPSPREAKLEEQLKTLQSRYDDFGGLQRYREANESLPATQPGRVVFFGDSITDGWTRNGGKFFPGKPYLNRGISGQTTEQMMVRFRQDVINLHPVAVVILAGTNDIAGNTGPETQEMIENNFRSMTELAKANGIRMILASLTPAAKYPWRPEVTDSVARIRGLNEWLRGYCKEQKITYLNYFDSMVGPDGGMKPGISKDGVHPNGEGYAIMESLAGKALAK